MEFNQKAWLNNGVPEVNLGTPRAQSASMGKSAGGL